MALYRICTEDKNRDKVERIVTGCFPGFTIIEAKGYWEGVREDSLVIELVTEDEERVNIVATRIKVVNEQQAVLIQRIECDKWLI